MNKKGKLRNGDFDKNKDDTGACCQPGAACTIF
jgi:hypothetical protein